MQESPVCFLSLSTVTDTSPSLRERKKLATRRAIHDAAFELAEEHGVCRSTIEAISDRAGVAPRTFWAYFSSKEDAVIGRDPDTPQKLRAALLARPADEDPTTALRRVLEHYVADRVVDSGRAVRRQRLIRREPQLMAAVAAAFNEMETALVSATAERLGLDPEMDLMPGVLVMAACGACRVAQQRWADRNGRQPFNELLDEAFARMAEGLAPRDTRTSGPAGSAVTNPEVSSAATSRRSDR